MLCSAGPQPVAIIAAQTGVTDRKAATQSSTNCPRSIKSCSVGARPVAIARSSIAGFIASMTARTSLRLTGSPQDPQARVLLALAAPPTEQQPHEHADDQHGQRWEQDREPAAEQRRAL